jgi:DNA-binding transcriptional LysR family regulator
MSIAGKNVGDEKRRSVNHLTVKSRWRWQARRRARLIPRGGPMQMHQIRYFLALCEERNFTRAARRCGVSQPSLTNAIIGLERDLGGALFQRKPLIALTALGSAVQPYLDRIAQNAEHARDAAQALADMPRANSEPAALDELARNPLSPSS